MDNHRTEPHDGLRNAQLVLNILLAVPVFLLGILTLFSPEGPGNALLENILVSTGLFGTTALLIYDIYRPFSGGLFLLIGAPAFAVLFNGFHLSKILLESRHVGYSPFWSAISVGIAGLGVLSLVRAGLRNRSRGQTNQQAE